MILYVIPHMNQFSSESSFLLLNIREPFGQDTFKVS